MRKILYIIPYLSIGGTEKHLLDLVNGFQDQYQLFLLAPPGETLEQFTKHRIAYYSFPRLDQNLAEGLRKFFHHIKQITKENQIDLIHIHGAPELMLLVRMAVRKIPILFTVHGFHGEMKSFDYWLCARLCNRFAAKVIAVAKAEEKILLEKGIRPRLIQTILNGVPDPLKQKFDNPAPLRNLPPDRVLIGAIARLETTKGIHFLIQAFTAIASQFPKLHLVIVGTGGKEPELKEQAARSGMDGRITFTGYQQNVHDYLHYFTIFVIPSLHEAHPLVLMEGMGHGKPIIATTVGGIPEVINNGENGLLVPPAQPDALAAALERLLNEKELAAKTGKNARESYEKEFTVERMLEETRKVYGNFDKSN
jgi:glycosyltransferase involved in cell wall biosynthesis